MKRRLIRAAAALLTITALTLVPASPAAADHIRDNQWHLRYLKVPEAHEISKGEGVTVAVIDTGVEPHPDLRGNLLPGTDVLPGGSKDGHRDVSGHGTAMAGLIGAHGRSGNNGALGIAPKSEILPVFALTAPDGKHDDGSIARGIAWATSQKVDVISLSVVTGPSPALRQALEAAIRADIVVVAGVGNAPMYYGIGFPAAYPGVVAVGGTDRRGNHAQISVTGPQMVISAPSDDIHSTARNGRYRSGTGTSNSTAIVAGAAALVRSKYPELSAQEVIHRLTATAVDKGKPGRDNEYGYGVLDVVAALTADVPPLSAESPGATAATSPPTTASPSPSVTAEGSDSGDSRLALLTLGVLLAAGVVTAVLWWRHQRSVVR